MEDILQEANKCLGCKRPMCREACPVHTNIPEFINRIKEKKFEEAYEILQENNIMSEICSIVCPTEIQCMGSCVRGIKGEPVNINKLEHFVNEWAKKSKIKYNEKQTNNNGKKIAIVGSGAAGISCAIELKKKGYNVTIFEKESKIGGVLEYEIPDFRLSKDRLISIQNKIENMGINIKFNTMFGRDVTLEKLKDEGYKCILLGLGANIPSKYEITDKKCDNIFVAKDIFNNYYNNQIRNLGKAIVIGGGNVAMDAARVAKKMKVEDVTIVYRRTKELMPAIKQEIEMAEKEDIKFVFNTKVIGANLDDKNNLKQIECLKTTIVDNRAQDIENSNFFIDANTVIFAIGLNIDEEFMKEMGIQTEDGLVRINEYGMTNIPGVFAAGDMVLKKPTVCKAIASGKKAAEGIDRYINNK